MMLFWFAFIAYFILVAVVSYRVFKVRDPRSFTLTVFAAPGHSCWPPTWPDHHQNHHRLYPPGLFPVFWAYAVLQLPKLLMMKFNPAFLPLPSPSPSPAGFKLTNGFLTKPATRSRAWASWLTSGDPQLSISPLCPVQIPQFMFAGEPKLNEQTA